MSKYWTTKEGEKILIKDLSDEHLRNITKMLKKKQVMVQEIYDEMLKRGYEKELPLLSVIQLWEIKLTYDHKLD